MHFCSKTISNAFACYIFPSLTLKILLNPILEVNIFLIAEYGQYIMTVYVVDVAEGIIFSLITMGGSFYYSKLFFFLHLEAYYYILEFDKYVAYRRW